MSIMKTVYYVKRLKCNQDKYRILDGSKMNFPDRRSVNISEGFALVGNPSHIYETYQFSPVTNVGTTIIPTQEMIVSALDDLTKDMHTIPVIIGCGYDNDTKSYVFILSKKYKLPNGTTTSYIIFTKSGYYIVDWNRNDEIPDVLVPASNKKLWCNDDPEIDNVIKQSLYYKDLKALNHIHMFDFDHISDFELDFLKGYFNKNRNAKHHTCIIYNNGLFTVYFREGLKFRRIVYDIDGHYTFTHIHIWNNYGTNAIYITDLISEGSL